MRKIQDDVQAHQRDRGQRTTYRGGPGVVAGCLEREEGGGKEVEIFGKRSAGAGRRHQNVLRQPWPIKKNKGGTVICWRRSIILGQGLSWPQQSCRLVA